MNKVQRFDTDPKKGPAAGLECSKEVVIKESRKGLADQCMFEGAPVRRLVDRHEGHTDFFGYDIREVSQRWSTRHTIPSPVPH